MQPFETRARYTSTWQDLESIQVDGGGNKYNQVDDLNADMSRQVDGKNRLKALLSLRINPHLK